MANHTDEEIFKLLGWAIIEWRIQYFKPNIVHPSWGDTYMIPDVMYELAEGLYRKYAERLGVPTYTIDMIELDESRGSVRMAISKLSDPPGRDSRPTIDLPELKKLLKTA